MTEKRVHLLVTIDPDGLHVLADGERLLTLTEPDALALADEITIAVEQARRGLLRVVA